MPYRWFIRILKNIDKMTSYKIGDLVRKMTDVNTSEFWDKKLDSYGEAWRDFPYRYIMEFLPKDVSFSLLDIGCALGDGCMLLKRHFPNAVIEGADFSYLAIEKANAKNTGLDFFVLDIKTQNPPRKYDFISLVHILEHFNDPFPMLDKCLKYADKAVLIVTPYVEEFDNPRLYSPGTHRYLFNEKTFYRYRCKSIKTTPYIQSAGYKYIVYEIGP